MRSGIAETSEPEPASLSDCLWDLSARPIAAPAAMIPTMNAAVRNGPDLRTVGASLIGKPLSSGGSAAATGSGEEGGGSAGSATLGGTVMGTVL